MLKKTERNILPIFIIAVSCYQPNSCELCLTSDILLSCYRRKMKRRKGSQCDGVLLQLPQNGTKMNITKSTKSTK